MKKKTFKKAIAFVTAIAVGAIACIPGNMSKANVAGEMNNSQTNLSTQSGTTMNIMNLGIKGLVDPKAATSANDEWQGCYVYYGIYDGQPVKYRVLDKDSTEFGGTTILLDCDTVLWDGTSSSGQHSRFDTDSNVWAESDIKLYMNSEKLEGSYDYSTTGFLTTSFTGLEREVIASSVKSSASSGNSSGISEALYVALTGEKIFFLDVKEAMDSRYGYYNTYNVIVARKKGFHWWLRSANKNHTNQAYIGNTTG